MSSRRRFLAAAAALASAPALAQPRPRQEHPGAGERLRFWAMGREGEVVRELLRDFERANPQVRLDIQGLPWTAAHEKLLTAFAGDAVPDLCQLGNTWIPEFAALQALEPLDGLVAAAGIAREDYFPGIWETNVIDGKLLGVPWYVDTRLLFYRTDLLAAAGFRAPPRDWDEWMRVLAAIKARRPADYAIILPLNEYEPLVALALQQDEPLLRDGGRYGNFRGEGFGRALDFYLGMFSRGLAPPSNDTQIANVWNEFAKGHFAFYITGPWQIGEFKRRLPAALQDDWMTAPLPGPRGPGHSIAGGSSLVVFRRSRVKAAAWMVVEYLSRPATQRRFHELTGNLPPRRASWAGDLDHDVHARAFRDQLERVKPAPKVPEWERIAQEMRLVTERAVRGDLAAAEVAPELDRRVDRMLEKRRWMLARGGR
jgi:multiple sugar transport system substrate-binding protein